MDASTDSFLGDCGDWLARGLIAAALMAAHDAVAEDRLGAAGAVIWAAAMVLSVVALLAYHRDRALAPAAD